MAVLVLDASVTLSWLLAENQIDSDKLLDQVVAEGAITSVLWPFEISNILINAERHQRITKKRRIEALQEVRQLPISIDGEAMAHLWNDVVDIAASYRLTVYDAAYLELAIRLAIPLATYDRALRLAASAARVSILPKMIS